MQRKYKKKNERKYSCTIMEKKFNSIFPLKNIIGHLIVADKKFKEDNSELFY
jgi:hypothetical protein